MQLTRRIAAGLVFTAFAGSARADDVKAVFDRAVKEHDDGKCEATPIGDRVLCERAAEDFRSVYSASPDALGALRDLAYTEKGLGRVASARRDFRELAAKAPNDPKPERRAWASFATQEADALEAHVPKLTLHVGSMPSGFAVQVDGQPAFVESPIDLDPGSHKIHAQAPGFQPFDGLVDLEDAEKKIVNVQLGTSASAAPAANASPTPPAAAPSAEPGGKPQESAPSKRSRLAPTVVTLAGAGVTLLGLGFGAAALITRNQNCDAQKQCDPDSLDTAHTYANVSTAAIALGLAATATGLVWYFLTPSDSASSPSAALVFTPRAASAVVRF